MKKLILFLLILFLIKHPTLSQWTSMSSFPNSYANDILFAGDTLFTATSGAGVYVSVNGGSNWSQINTGLNNSQAISVNQLLLNANIIYAATVDGIYKSTNRGANWVKKSSGIVIGGGAIYEFTKSIFAINGKLFTGAWTGIYTSTDGAESWQVSNIFGSAVIAKNFTSHNGNMFAARETNNTPYAYTSTDGGITWNHYNTINFPTITFFSEPPVIWAGTIDGVWLSTNNGASWQERNSGLSLDPYSSSIIRVSGTLVTSLKFGGSGVFRSSNNGSNWEDIGQGLPFLNSIEKLVVYNGKVLAATSSGIWQRNISEIVVGTVNHSKRVPQSFNLYQNYPNPFNPVTRIKFDVPDIKGEKLRVKLVLFDISGKEAGTLIDKELSSGVYEIAWDASSYPSGVYYCSLEAGDYRETRKMVLLK